MDLWTEFEGVTIDSAFALSKLLQSEGRSAFFSTVNAKGESVLIRIVECHFDEDEILARWRGVQTLGHPNFLRIDRFGQFLIEEDGITAVYALFERIDANLGQVLEQGCLSPTDAAQIGLAIASALETLHSHGFVHQHIEPRKVFSVGEIVKLRSDCIRETPEGQAGFEARRRDIHDLSLLLMHVLRGMTLPSGTTAQRPLPAPFDEIVRNGMEGNWGLAEITAALTPIAQAKASKAAPAARQAVSATTAKLRDLVAKPAASAEPARTEPQPEQAALPFSESPAGRSFPRSAPLRFEPKINFGPDRPLPRWIVPAGMLVFVLLLGWLFAHLFFGHQSATATQAPQPAAVGSRSRAVSTRSTSQRGTPHQAPTTPVPASNGSTEWRVVAFTYNHQDQAQKKAASLSQQHPDLQPQVFSPKGRAPWLVTIGGALQRDAAYALARKARSLGLPRDTYAQNYTQR